jgi:hypothetical protein
MGGCPSIGSPPHSTKAPNMSPAIGRARTHLAELREELAAATAHGLADHPAYRADLTEAMSAARAAYVCAAVTEIASFRAELGGPQVG